MASVRRQWLLVPWWRLLIQIMKPRPREGSLRPSLMSEGPFSSAARNKQSFDFPASYRQAPDIRFLF